MSELKAALRKLAKAVVVVTTKHAGTRYAMSATAVSEISLDPPTMLVCINRTASIHPAVAGSGRYCLNILHHSDREIAQLCGGGARGEDRFNVGDWIDTETGCPRLANAEAAVVCKVIQSTSVGTHDIVVGEVEEVFVSETAEPLIYVDGRYTHAPAGQLAG